MKMFNISDEYEKPEFLYDLEEQAYGYLEGCKSVCGKYGALWPKPTGPVVINPALSTFNFDDISFQGPILTTFL